MLRAIGEPVSFAILLLSFVVALTLIGWTTSLLAARQGQPALRAEGRTRPDPRRQLDPYGLIAVGLGGIGWAKPVDAPRRSAGQVAVVVLTGPILALVLGLGLLAVWAQAFDVSSGASFNGVSLLLREGVSSEFLPAEQQALLLPGLVLTYVGALAIVPLPPLPGGQVLFAAAPRTLGWQKAEHQLVERNIGTAVLLALVLIPLGGPDPILQNVLDEVLSPLIELVTGA